MDFDKQIILVTGAARHTGYAVAASFLEKGAIVVLNDRLEEEVAAAVKELAAQYGERVVPGAADITDELQLDRLFEHIAARFGRLDVLVNNACLQAIAFDFLEGSYEEWNRVVDVNLNGLFLVSQRAARLMARQGSGSIVHMGSNAATHALRARSPYGATKGAVDALTKAMALDLAPFGIRVNTVVPGYVRTSRWDHITDEEAAKRRANIPLGMETLYEDVAFFVQVAASRQAKNMTGARLVVDGGSTSQLVPASHEAVISKAGEVEQ